MTREEAIEYIQEWLKDEYALNGKDRVVLNLAIEALEKEPSCRNTRQVDLISRQQAIKEISDEFENEWEEADVNFNHGLNMALSIIKALNSAEQKRGEKTKTLFMNLYNCEKFENLSNGVIYMKIPKCSIYDEIGREVIVNCVRQDNFECCFTNAFEQVERIEGE